MSRVQPLRDPAPRTLLRLPCPPALLLQAGPAAEREPSPRRGQAIGLLFGTGNGAFLAVDFAIVLDVLPSVRDSARDMAVWHASLVLPQLLATPIAGTLLDACQTLGKRADPSSTLGYTVIFVLAAAYFVPGTVFIRRVNVR